MRQEFYVCVCDCECVSGLRGEWGGWRGGDLTQKASRRPGCG